MDSFFKPQTPSVNLDLAGDTEQFKRDLQEFGLNEAIISSGRRDPKGTLELLKQRKQREGLDKLEDPAVQEVLDHFLLRGKTPDKLDYPSNTDWRTPLQQQLQGKVPDVNKIIEAVGKIRGDFGGYQSPHLDGRKVDLSAQDYGVDKLKELQKFLQTKGYETLYEPHAGQKGVLDIRLKDIQQKIENAEASGAPMEEIEELKLQETALESALKQVGPEPTQPPMMRPDQLKEMTPTPQPMPQPAIASQPVPQQPAEPQKSSEEQVQDLLQRLREELPQEQEQAPLEDRMQELMQRLRSEEVVEMPVIDPTAPEALDSPEQQLLDKMKQEQSQEASMAQRLKEAQDKQRRDMAMLAFSRFGQRDFKEGQKALEQVYGSQVTDEKDLLAMELKDQDLKDEQSSRDIFRKFLQKQAPEMEISKDVPVKYLQQLVNLQARGMNMNPFQQSQYMTAEGDPVIFEKTTGQYKNVVTGEPVREPGSLIRNYVKTITDPRTGEVVEVRPGVGTVGSLVSEIKGTEKTLPEEQKVDVTYEMLTPNQRKDFKDVENQFMADIKDAREFGDTLEGIGDLVEADISAAIPAIKRQLARSVGREVGVMTDKDVEAFSGDQSLIGALERYAKMQLMGTMTERDKSQYDRLISIARANLNEALKSRGRYHVNRLQNRIPGATEESLKSLMSVDASMPVGIDGPPVPEGRVRVELPDGTKGTIDSSKLEDFKKAYPKAKVFN